MTKELIIEILKHNGNLYTVIDNFIAMNYGNGYFIYIKQIYEETIAIVYPKQIGSYTLAKVTGIAIYSLYALFGQLQSLDILTDEKIAKEYHKMWHSKHHFNRFIKTTQEIYEFNKMFIPLSEIALVLSLFSSKFFTTNEFEDMYIEKVANFIHSEISNGNVSFEFITYLYTFVA